MVTVINIVEEWIFAIWNAVQYNCKRRCCEILPSLMRSIFDVFVGWIIRCDRSMCVKFGLQIKFVKGYCTVIAVCNK